MKLTYPLNNHLDLTSGLKQIVKYERQPNLDPFIRDKVLKPQNVYEYRTTMEDPREKLYSESLRGNTLKASASLSILPKDYFQRYKLSENGA